MRVKYVLVSIGLILLIVNVGMSCPVCYGQTDTHTASAVNAAIFSMLIVTGTVLSFFASLIVYLRKRLRLSAATNSDEVH